MSLYLPLFMLVIGYAAAERIYAAPDVSWQRPPSSQSSSSGVFQESNVRPSSISRGNSFDSDNSFPNSRPGSSASSSSGSNFGFTGDRDRPSSVVSSGSGSRGPSVSSGSDSRFPITGGSGVRPSSVIDPERQNYVRIIAALVLLNNSKGITSTGSSCSTFGKCDPLVFADLDTELPNAEWPGARESKTWPQIFAAKDANSFDINLNNITKDICGQTYREANLRVRVEDKKTLLSNAVINEFNCIIRREPQDGQVSATWSPTMECLPRFQAGKMALTYRFKVFYVPKSECRATAASATSSKTG